jgi:hypothetical protein
MKNNILKFLILFIQLLFTILKKFLKNENLLYLFYLPIFINSILNFIDRFSLNKVKEINLYNLLSSLILFLFVVVVGMLLKEIFSFPYISTGIILYFMSFFLLDNTVLFFYTKLKFSSIFFCTNFIWVLFFLMKTIKRYYLIFPVFLYGILNIFNVYFFEKLTTDKNIIGDVRDIHYTHVKNIYENSYFYSMNNPRLEGYPQISAYVQSLLNQISINTETFNYLSSSINVLFLLFILFFYEIELSKRSTNILISIFALLIFNSQWLKFLFVDSLMTEGVLSYLFVVLFLSCLKEIDRLSKSSYLIFFLMGLLYLSKQFFSLLALLIIIIFILKKTTRKYALLGLFGVFLKEIRQHTFFRDLQKDYHLKEVDLVDTFFDLLFLRDLKINNIFIILKNLYIDTPIFILFAYLVLLTIAYFYLFRFRNEDINIVSSIIYLNFLFIFILYITIWKTMELETPIRYMLNLLPLILYFQFKIIDKLKQKIQK